jgi:hypothetical protein
MFRSLNFNLIAFFSCSLKPTTMDYATGVAKWSRRTVFVNTLAGKLKSNFVVCATSNFPHIKGFPHTFSQISTKCKYYFTIFYIFLNIVNKFYFNFYFQFLLCDQCGKMVQMDSLRKHSCREIKIKFCGVCNIKFSTHHRFSTQLLSNKHKMRDNFYYATSVAKWSRRTVFVNTPAWKLKSNFVVCATSNFPHIKGFPHTFSQISTMKFENFHKPNQINSVDC